MHKEDVTAWLHSARKVSSPSRMRGRGAEVSKTLCSIGNKKTTCYAGAVSESTAVLWKKSNKMFKTY